MKKLFTLVILVATSTFTQGAVTFSKKEQVLDNCRKQNVTYTNYFSAKKTDPCAGINFDNLLVGNNTDEIILVEQK